MSSRHNPVVRSADLCPILERFLRHHEVDHPFVSNFEKNSKSMSGREYLAIKSGVSTKMISRIMKREMEHVNLDAADRLLVAIGEQAEFNSSVPILGFENFLGEGLPTIVD